MLDTFRGHDTVVIASGSPQAGGSGRAPRREVALALGGVPRLEIEPQERLGVRRAQVEPPVAELDCDPVEVVDLGTPAR